MLVWTLSDGPLHIFFCFQIDDLTPKPSVPSQAVGEFKKKAKNFMPICSSYRI